MRKLSPVLFIIIGFILAAPFIIDVAILGNIYFKMTIWIALRMLGLIVGGPMFVGGIISLLTVKGYGPRRSMSDIDTARIRYAVEEDLKRRK